MTNILRSVVELLGSAGDPAIGFEGSVEAAEAHAILNFAGRQYCLVREWIIVEIEVTNEYRVDLASDGLSPFVLYAADVVLHSTGKRRPGDWVRSTYQTFIIPEHVFQTRNTTYVLVGPGSRKRLPWKQ
ncbi:DUF6957 family protein [Pseudomonas sp. ICMP 561]|uniref:DUF6957 family protein n=1 Tax=Pseudomonas sp. ICMP 561 TaxID=1718918 RepID=UPI000C07F1C5|nr:hypothetical protein [Pseudomonas sp. ICMP 561]PHN17206.1 hypothetical protein AO242_21165 [Pseudomonas sp. ICMP 561]